MSSQARVPAASLRRIVQRGVAPLLVMTCLLLGMSTPAPASVKPCRNADGKVIMCAKPSPTPVERCKDASGKFIKCSAGKAAPAKPR